MVRTAYSRLRGILPAACATIALVVSFIFESHELLYTGLAGTGFEIWKFIIGLFCDQRRISTSNEPFQYKFMATSQYSLNLL